MHISLKTNLSPGTARSISMWVSRVISVLTNVAKLSLRPWRRDDFLPIGICFLVAFRCVAAPSDDAIVVRYIVLAHGGDEPFSPTNCFPRQNFISTQQMKSDKFFPTNKFQSRTSSTLHNNIDPLASISSVLFSFILSNFPMPEELYSGWVVNKPFWYALYVSFFRSPRVKMYNLADVKRSVQVHNNKSAFLCLYKDRVHCRVNRSVAHENIIKDESFIASTACN